MLGVSDALYQGIVRHGHGGLLPEAFHRVTVQGKEGDFTAWLHGEPAPAPSPSPSAVPAAAAAPTPGPAPAPPAAQAPDPAESRAPATFQFLGGSPTFGGNLIGGDQHIVSGGQVHGDVNTGNTVGGER